MLIYKLLIDVCVRFAKNQPAPRGNLAVHCGGPGSLSSCVHDWDFDLGSDNIGMCTIILERSLYSSSYTHLVHRFTIENYNIIGFDQVRTCMYCRGIGPFLIYTSDSILLTL